MNLRSRMPHLMAWIFPVYEVTPFPLLLQLPLSQAHTLNQILCRPAVPFNNPLTSDFPQTWSQDWGLEGQPWEVAPTMPESSSHSKGLCSN